MSGFTELWPENTERTAVLQDGFSTRVIESYVGDLNYITIICMKYKAGDFGMWRKAGDGGVRIYGNVSGEYGKDSGGDRWIEYPSFRILRM